MTHDHDEHHHGEHGHEVRHHHDEAHHHDDPGRTRIHDRHHRHAERHGRRRGHGFDRPMRGGYGRGDGRRAGRGDIRAAILALLAEEPMHGYQMIQELGTRSGGAWTPSPGSIYPALQMLQDEGLIAATDTDGKKVFTLTDPGRQAAAERGDAPLPWEAAARGERSGLAELRKLVMQVANAVHQVADVGTEDQLAKAVALLTATRRELYRILAEDDAEPNE